MRETFGAQVAVLPPNDVAAIIAAGGFEAPLQCYQSVLIHGWLARRDHGMGNGTVRSHPSPT